MLSFTRCGVWKFAASLALVLNAGAIVASAQFDPSAQFSPTINPNGVWTYAYEDVPLGSPVIPLTVPTPIPSSPGPIINSWLSPSFGPVGVYDNPTAQPQLVTTFAGPETSLFQPGELGMNTGPNDEFALVEFTAPAPGNYVIQGIFEGLDTAGTLSTADLLWNNSLVATGNVIGFGPGSDIPLSAGPFFLNAGDTLAFAVGGGPSDSMTAILPGAMVAAVGIPEPASVFLTAIAGFGLLMYRPQRTHFHSFQY